MNFNFTNTFSTLHRGVDILAGIAIVQLTMSLRNNALSWRDVIKVAASATLNYGFFYAGAAISRGIAEYAYPMVAGPRPSALWDPVGFTNYECNETAAVRYAMDYGPYAVVTIGSAISSVAVNALENIANKSFSVGKGLFNLFRNGANRLSAMAVAPPPAGAAPRI